MWQSYPSFLTKIFPVLCGGSPGLGIEYVSKMAKNFPAFFKLFFSSFGYTFYPRFKYTCATPISDTLLIPTHLSSIHACTSLFPTSERHNTQFPMYSSPLVLECIILQSLQLTASVAQAHSAARWTECLFHSPGDNHLSQLFCWCLESIYLQYTCPLCQRVVLHINSTCLHKETECLGKLLCIDCVSTPCSQCTKVHQDELLKMDTQNSWQLNF